MDPKSADRIFWEASELSSDSEREEYLNRACRDEKLRRKVDCLLQARGEAEDFLESPPA